MWGSRKSEAFRVRGSKCNPLSLAFVSIHKKMHQYIHQNSCLQDKCVFNIFQLQHRRPVCGTRELWILCTASEKIESRVQSPDWSRLSSLDVKRDLTTRYPFEIKTPERTNSLSYPKAERTNSQAKLLVPLASLPCSLIALAPLKRRTLGPGQQ